MSRRFFGYGSLVNLDTHDYPSPQPAKVHDWQRVWRFSTRRNLAYLSVMPAQGVEILGIVADVPGQDWQALDQREAAYLRHDVSENLSHSGVSDQTAMYQVDPDHMCDPGPDHRILLSYLDVVIQGYARQFGADGPRHFMETTTGWGVPLLNDRADPIYPRAQSLSPDETHLVDAVLADLPAPVQIAEL